MSASSRQGLVAGFKRAFHVKQTVPDTTQWQASLTRQMADLKKWVTLYTELNPAGRAATVSHLQEANQLFGTASRDLKSNPTQGVTYTRDTALPRLVALVDQYRKSAKEAPAKRQVGQKAVDVFWTDLPGFDALPDEKRQAVLDAAAKKTADGLELYQKICHPQPGDQPLPNATPKEVTNLMWALKSKAQTKNGPYVKGALTIPNGPALRSYLDSCGEEVYRRDSSHMLEQQGKGKAQKPDERPGPGQTARGMDFYGGDAGLGSDPPDLDRLLPAGMNALLYQQMKSPTGADTLYVKLETESAYLSGGGNKKIDTTSADLQTREFRRSDVGHSLKHLGNLIKSKVPLFSSEEDEDLSSTREKTPGEIKWLCKQIVKAAKNKNAKKILAASYGTETAWGGIKKVRYPRINSFLAALEKVDQQGDLEEELIPLLQALFAELDREFGAMSVSEMDRRMGEEVVMDDAEMA